MGHRREREEDEGEEERVRGKEEGEKGRIWRRGVEGGGIGNVGGGRRGAEKEKGHYKKEGEERRRSLGRKRKREEGSEEGGRRGQGGDSGVGDKIPAGQLVDQQSEWRSMALRVGLLLLWVCQLHSVISPDYEGKSQRDSVRGGHLKTESCPSSAI